MNQHVRSDQMFVHHADEVATAADSDRPWVAKVFDRVFEVTRIDVGEGCYASTPRILSRVIGKSLTRFPIAL